MDAIVGAIVYEIIDNNGAMIPRARCYLHLAFFCGINARPRIETDQRVIRMAIFMLVRRILAKSAVKRISGAAV